MRLRMAKINLDNVRNKVAKMEEENKRRESGGDHKYYKITSKADGNKNQGRNVLRVCPPFNEEGDFYKEGGYHYNIGPDKKSVACRKMFGLGKCPICELVDSLFKTKDDDDKKLAKDIRAKAKFFFNIYVEEANEEKYGDRKVFILGCTKTVFEQILGIIADPEWGDITDPKTGHNITIKKTGEKLGTEYATNASPKATPLPKGIVAQMFDLDTELTADDYEKVKSVLEGEEVDDDEDDEDDDEKDAKKSSKSSKSKKEEPPAKSNKSKSKSKEPEPDEDDDEDEDEEPAPKSKKSDKSKAKKAEPEPEPDEDNPECFGEHEEGDDTCIECDCEDECAAKTHKGKSRKRN